MEEENLFFSKFSLIEFFLTLDNKDGRKKNISRTPVTRGLEIKNYVHVHLGIFHYYFF